MGSTKNPYTMGRAVCILGAISLMGCEYEFKEDPPLSANVVEVVISDNLRSPEDRAKERLQAPTPVPNVRPVLAPGKDVSGQAALPPKAKRLNLPGLLESGELSVTSNVLGSRDLPLAFDEIEDSLAKSEGINPFKLSFQFKTPRTFRAIRVLSTYSDYGLAVELAGAERLTVDTVIDGQWSTVAWPDGIKSSQVTVEVLRKVRDNYVHLNEVELYE
jgi:hypothetical protein